MVLAARIAFREEKPDDPQRRRNMANTQWLLASVHLENTDCEKAREALQRAHENLARAMSEYEQKAGIPKAGWEAQLKGIELLQNRARNEFPTQLRRGLSIPSTGKHGLFVVTDILQDLAQTLVELLVQPYDTQWHVSARDWLAALPEDRSNGFLQSSACARLGS